MHLPRRRGRPHYRIEVDRSGSASQAQFNRLIPPARGFHRGPDGMVGQETHFGSPRRPCINARQMSTYRKTTSPRRGSSTIKPLVVALARLDVPRLYHDGLLSCAGPGAGATRRCSRLGCPSFARCSRETFGHPPSVRSASHAGDKAQRPCVWSPIVRFL